MSNDNKAAILYEARKIEPIIEAIKEFIEAERLKGMLYNFYDLETHFIGQITRGELIQAMKIMRLSGMFDEIFWEALLQYSPSKVKESILGEKTTEI
ncbi:hypothetical protein [Vibrio sp. Vb339]|uniref:hypothetical protein n=1 Tax=Vibrio sp. Vb339 TaxID=1192013 RepID=UPI001553B77B|nr:hypothetical protein [Vibrio sp. Vb339]